MARRALEYLRRATLAAQMCFLLTKATTGHLVLDLTKNSNKKHGKGLMYHNLAVSNESIYFAMISQMAFLVYS